MARAMTFAGRSLSLWPPSNHPPREPGAANNPPGKIQMTEFSDLVGVTLESVVNNSDEQIVFTATDGRVWRQSHSQDCCEYVRVEEVHGDLSDLIGTPILIAEEATYDNEPDPDGRTGSDEDYRWTFYKLATVKGHVTIRWLGESNGYYSTDVSFYQGSAA